MIIKHQGKEPKIDTTSYVAPNATICGDVTIGKNVRIMFGAQVIAENSSINIGDNCIVLENEVVPIGWVAVGNPMKLFPPEKHNEIWEMQKPLNFPEYVYGLKREENNELVSNVCKVMSDRLHEHKNDEVI